MKILESKINKAIEKYLLGDIEDLSPIDIFANIVVLLKTVKDAFPIILFFDSITYGFGNVLNIVDRDFSKAEEEINEDDLTILKSYYKVLLFAVATLEELKSKTDSEQKDPLIRAIEESPDDVSKELSKIFKKLPKGALN